jgi:zona occludens toxin
MAISYYTGIPRSGKSLKAVAKIYHTFVSLMIYFRLSFGKIGFPKKDENILKTYNFKFFKIYKLQKNIPYENCYTNINQFNFSISDKIFKFDFEDIYIKLSILNAMYIDKKTDDELIEKAKELNIYKSLFVIDEAHNYLKRKEDSVLVWWFTYHAHLYQDIILITQDLKLVNDEYKRTAEYFYRAIPQRLRLNKNVFKYRSYSSYQMYQKDILGTESLKVIPEYFKLYVSGDSPKSKSILHKYIFFIILSILFLLYSFRNFTDQFSTSSSAVETTAVQELPQNQTTLNNSVPIVSPGVKDEIINPGVTPGINQNLKLFKFNCFDKFCYYKIDKKSTIEIPMNILKSFLMNIDEDKKFTEIKNNRLYIYALVDETKFNFMNKGVTNENEKNNTNILPTVGLN